MLHQGQNHNNLKYSFPVIGAACWGDPNSCHIQLICFLCNGCLNAHPIAAIWRSMCSSTSNKTFKGCVCICSNMGLYNSNDLENTFIHLLNWSTIYFSVENQLSSSMAPQRFSNHIVPVEVSLMTHANFGTCACPRDGMQFQSTFRIFHHKSIPLNCMFSCTFNKHIDVMTSWESLYPNSPSHHCSVIFRCH